MSLNLQIINPLDYQGWDDLLLSADEHSFFFTSWWAAVLHESYGYKPLYFTSIEENEISILIPVMEVNSFLTGKRGVSLPFSDHCDPVAISKERFKDTFEALIDYGKRAGWKHIEIRGGKDIVGQAVPSSFYYEHKLDLSSGEKHVFSTFRDSIRRNIRKAEKQGVTAEISHSVEAVQEFYRLNCLSRRDHGLPPQPFCFFRNVHNHIIAREKGFVVLASHEGRSIAGAVFFHHGEKAFYKYGASEKKYQHLRPNNLVMWRAIQWCCRNGFKSFSFGRTGPGNEGLRRFKAGWGTKENIINYYKYDLKEKAFIKSDNHLSGFHNKVFRTMPIPLLKAAGSFLYKHLG